LHLRKLGIDIEWQGTGIEEKGINKEDGKALIEVDPKYFRPTEVEQLLGNPTKAKTVLGWNPVKTSFKELIKIMVKSDIKYVERENRIRKEFD
jgi:GDPmannose 4,6-dehydratase